MEVEYSAAFHLSGNVICFWHEIMILYGLLAEWDYLHGKLLVILWLRKMIRLLNLKWPQR